MGEIDLNSTGTIIGLKIGYFLLAWWLLGVIYRLAPKSGVAKFQELRFRMLMVFRTVNVLLIIGFAFFEVRWPLWLWLARTRELLLAYLEGDLVNFSLLIGYLTGMLYLAYRMDRKIKGISSGFGSYLMQYGYFWMFVLNTFILLRLDYYYLPLIAKELPSRYRWILEAGAIALLVGLQLLALWVRRVKVVPADPEVERLVREVAAEFKVKVSKVGIWRLENVINAYATGIFMKSILLTETLVNSLEPADLRMIIGHELAHFKRRHLGMRVIFIVGLVFLGSSLVEDYPDLPAVVYGIYWIMAVLIYNLFARYQEFEADRLSALKLGGGEQMAQALTRIAVPVKFGRFFKWLVGHPDLETRVKRLGKIKERRQEKYYNN